MLDLTGLARRKRRDQTVDEVLNPSFCWAVQGAYADDRHVQRRMILCTYGITTDGKRELIDHLIVKAEGEDTWKLSLKFLPPRLEPRG